MMSLSRTSAFMALLMGGSLLSGSALAASPPAKIIDTYDFTVDYDVYAGGLHLIDVVQQFKMTGKTYSSTMTAKPTGVFSRIVPWEGRYTTQGRLAGDVLVPERHEKSSRWGDEHDESVMVFDSEGDLVSMTNADWIDKKTKPAPEDVTPDKALSHKAVDLVTSVLRMLQAAQNRGLSNTQSCDNAQTVFDGKRRFTMQFRDLGKDTLNKTQYSAFKGDARHCEIEIKPLAGFKGKKRGFYKIQEDSRAQGELPSIWLMPAWTTVTGGAPPIPVRMKIKSEYGAIMVHATKVTQTPSK